MKVVWREIAPDSPKQICMGLKETLICTLIFGKSAGRGPGAQPLGAQANLCKLGPALQTFLLDVQVTSWEGSMMARKETYLKIYLHAV